jgi:hypothetical protein
MVRLAIATLLAGLLASPALAAGTPKPKMCGVYVKYACGNSTHAPKAKAKKTCGVYVKYSC